MKIQLNRESSVPLYLQIVNQIKDQIMAGILPAGYKLPPERRLADSLLVNRTTVLNAYRELKAENLIGAHVGKGTIVMPLQKKEPHDQVTGQKPIWNYFFSEYSNRSADRVINDLLSLANRTDVISFATGMASPQCIPSTIINGMEELLAQGRYQALLHSPVEGFASLRKAISSYMERKGCFSRPEEVMLLSGSQQGIDLVARILIDPGDIVFMEDPTFFPALKVFRMAGARVIGIPMDHDGMKIDVLKQLLQQYRPKLIYTIPSFHNPTGTEMSLERRKQLLELVNHYKIPVLEDDAYGELCYQGEPLPSLKSMDYSGYVIYLNTFSKTVYPGLRIGWIVADKKVVARLAGVRQTVDLHTNCLSQIIIERYLASGRIENHLKMISEQYRERRDLMALTLSKHQDSGIRFHIPRGGYYIWCQLPKEVSEDDLVKKAGADGVVFLPGACCFVTVPAGGFIRLNFTFADRKEITRGIEILCHAIKELKENGSRTGSGELIDLNPIV